MNYKIILTVIISIALGFGAFAIFSTVKNTTKQSVKFPDGTILVLKSKNKSVVEDVSKFLNNNMAPAQAPAPAVATK